MSRNIRDCVERILHSVFPAIDTEFKDAWGPGDVEGWDSMGHLDLMMALSEEFGIELEFEEVMSIEKIEDIYTILEAKGIA